MRKTKWIISLILLIIVCGCSPNATAAPTVHLDGRQLAFEVPPMIENGRTLVPVRAIFEEMGATVTWDSATYSATAVKGNTTVVLHVGSTTPTVNGQVKQMDVPAKIVNGRTLAPLRFVGEAFGGTVQWDPATQLITITSIPGSGSSVTNQIKVHFIDVGQADAIYIQLPGHNDILIDGGNVDDGRLVTNYLKAQGVDDIELIIATHPHEDHIGGMADIFNEFKVEMVLDSGIAYKTSTYDNYWEKVDLEDCSYEVHNYQTFTWGSAVLQILTGYRPNLDVHNGSVVARLDTGNIEYLFMGDAGFTAESLLQGDISADILKVGHHGSYTSTAVSFLSRVAPKVAVISVGADNMYGHPYPTVINRLQANGATVYRTDLNGTIVVTTDGNDYSISTSKSLPAAIDPVVTPVNPSSQDTSQYVGSKNSNKYHYPSCSGAKQIKEANKIWFNSEAEAIAAGYVPCAICKP